MKYPDDYINKIICGDCLEVMKGMQDKSVDHVFTSPPYNRKRNDKYTHYRDILVDYFELLKCSISESLRLSKGFVFLNIQKNLYNKVEVNKIIGYFSEQIVEIIIWEKTNPMPAAGKAITNSWEFFLVLGDNSLKSNGTYTKNIISTSVNSSMPKEHKAVMKLDVAEWFIKSFTQDGDVILDPFFGIGTTGVAASRNKRKFIGIDITKEYCEIAQRRLAQEYLF